MNTGAHPDYRSFVGFANLSVRSMGRRCLGHSFSFVSFQRYISFVRFNPNIINKCNTGPIILKLSGTSHYFAKYCWRTHLIQIHLNSPLKRCSMCVKWIACRFIVFIGARVINTQHVSYTCKHLLIDNRTHAHIRFGTLISFIR